MTISPQTFPDIEKFEAQYNNGDAQICYRRIESDLETPVSVYLKVAHEAANSFLLESVEGGEVLGRHSIIGLKPDLIWRADHKHGYFNRGILEGEDVFVRDNRPIMDSFQALLDESAIDLPENLASMAAGVFGYFGYDFVRQCEHLPNRPPMGVDIPDAIFIRPTIVIIFDNIRQEMLVATPVRAKKNQTAKEAYALAEARLEEACRAMEAPVNHRATSFDGSQAIGKTDILSNITSNMTPTDFTDKVKKAKDYIRAGDIFQVVLSQCFETPFSASPFSLYRSLRRENPSPFLFFLNFDSHALVGSSPEILVRVSSGEVTIRPIAGTRARGKTHPEDKALEQELLADPKERAEHLMLLDLGRNDVGRSAKTNSVKVTDSFIVERYSHVMHIVSNVMGQLRDDVTPVEALMAGFPAGTVSGAPKIRAMEIIDELEPQSRNAYAGAIGYFSAGGEVDTAITLRTGLVKDGKLYVQAGAGIVSDSNPQAEQQECVDKSMALFSAAAKVIKN